MTSSSPLVRWLTKEGYWNQPGGPQWGPQWEWMTAREQVDGMTRLTARFLTQLATFFQDPASSLVPSLRDSPVVVNVMGFLARRVSGSKQGQGWRINEDVDLSVIPSMLSTAESRQQWLEMLPRILARPLANWIEGYLTPERVLASLPSDEIVRRFSSVHVHRKDTNDFYLSSAEDADTVSVQYNSQTQRFHTLERSPPLKKPKVVSSSLSSLSSSSSKKVSSSSSSSYKPQSLVPTSAFKSVSSYPSYSSSSYSSYTKSSPTVVIVDEDEEEEATTEPLLSKTSFKSSSNVVGISSFCHQRPQTTYSPPDLSGECRKVVPTNLQNSCWTDSFLMALCHLAENPIVEEILRLAAHEVERLAEIKRLASSSSSPSALVPLLALILFVMHRLINRQTVTEHDLQSHPDGQRWLDAMRDEEMPDEVLSNPNLLVCYFRRALQRHAPRQSQQWSCDTFDPEDVWTLFRETIPTLDDFLIEYDKGEDKATEIYLTDQREIYPEWNVDRNAPLHEQYKSFKVFLTGKENRPRPEVVAEIEQERNAVKVKPFLNESLLASQQKPFLVTIVPRGGLMTYKDTTPFPILSQVGNYELVSVTWHSGSVKGGHHTCYLKCGGEWFLADDVGPSLVHVPTFPNNIVEKGSNLLVYVRR